MARPYAVNVLEQCRVSPPPGSVPQTSLPLTFFDIIWLGTTSPTQRLLFFEFHHPTTHFTNTILPNIKHSLSLTLQHFYPLAGNLKWPPESIEPEIHYTDGNSVSLTVAESNDNFNHLLGNHARDVNRLYPLIPQLPKMSNALLPLFALQVTVFPNSGICVGITYKHLIADGKACFHFIKSWASACRLGGETCFVAESLPFYDRTVIKDPTGIDPSYLNMWRKNSVSQQRLNIFNTPIVLPVDKLPVDKVRATFVMGRPDIDRLKRWVLTRLQKDKPTIGVPPPFHVSSFVVTCAYVWVCLIKSRGSEDVSKEENEHFVFPVECRGRLVPPIPVTYFGNCVMGYIVEAKRNDLIGEDGIAVAADVIGKVIRKLDDGIFRAAEHQSADFASSVRGPVLTVAGSPKLAAYETDFGWGRPKKSEVISIDENGAMSLHECRDGEGGLEVGLALTKLQMDAFASLFEHDLKLLT